MTPPLRFLAFALGGWALVRGAILAQGEGEAAAPTPPAHRAAALHAEAPEMRPRCLARHLSCAPDTAPAHRRNASAFPATGLPRPYGPRNDERIRPHRPLPSLRAKRSNLPAETHRPPSPLPPLPPAALAPSAPIRIGTVATPFFPSFPAAPPNLRTPSRWSLSAWAFARRGGAGPALAPGGTLGGSQAGVRALYRLGPGLSAAARLSTPRATAAAEAALGVEWQPLPRLPLRLLAERRQALGGGGRTGFALLAHGGVSEAALGPFHLDAYVQAGAVGLARRDLFADGAARLSVPLGARLSIGAGTWAAAQPGAARLDVGPTLTLRLPETNARATLDWRLKAAGNARPASGPALTLAADF